MDWMNVVKLWVLPKVNHKYGAIKKNHILHRIFYNFLKLFWKHKRLQITKAAGSEAGSSILSTLKLYYKAIITKTVWYCYKNKYTDQ